MKIEVKKFGDMLISHPQGKEDFLVISSILKDSKNIKSIEVDFFGVKVLTPSWAEEVLFPLSKKFNNIKLLNIENPSVQATLKTLREYSDLKI